MATIVKRKSDNVVTHYAQSADFDAGYLTFVKVAGGEVISPATTSSTHEIINSVTLPTSYFGNMLTYIDGDFAILTDAVDAENASRKAIRDAQDTDAPPDIEVEI